MPPMPRADAPDAAVADLPDESLHALWSPAPAAAPRPRKTLEDVLLANGCAVDTPFRQPCCGSLHAHNGETRLAEGLARRMIDLFPPDRYDAIISNAQLRRAIGRYP